MLDTLTPTSAQSSDEASLTTSGTLPDWVVLLEPLLDDKSELLPPPPPQAASVAASTAHTAFRSIVSFMTRPPCDIP
jgi:hypothetical protein